MALKRFFTGKTHHEISPAEEALRLSGRLIKETTLRDTSRYTGHNLREIRAGRGGNGFEAARRRDKAAVS